jgi:hypothetical protein
MKRWAFLLFALFCCADLFATSAVRKPTEDYRAVAKKYLPRIKPWGPLTTRMATNSAYGLANAWSTIDTTTAAKESKIDVLFNYIRDQRELTESTDPGFLRRVSWLYPIDGCWIRAAIVGHWAEREKFSTPSRLFIFGNLNVSTTNAPSGSVSWWYHVAPALRDSSGTLLVLDPAINPDKPMEAEDWIKTMVPAVSDATLSLCSRYTYEPYDNCDSTSSSTDSNAEIDIESYLRRERQNLISMHRDADEELGDNPPWIKPVP